GASGTAMAMWYNGANPLSGYASTSDYNCWYAGTPGSQHLILYCTSGSDQTLAAFQTRVSTRDAHSISINPGFTSQTDLHKTNMTNSSPLAAGTPISGFTTDIDGDTRNATTPDMGADEFAACTPPNPGAISGGTHICSGTTGLVYSIAAVSSATS